MLKIAQQDNHEDQLKPKVPDSSKQSTFPETGRVTVHKPHSHAHPTPPPASPHACAAKGSSPWELSGRHLEAQMQNRDWETMIRRAELHT